MLIVPLPNRAILPIQCTTCNSQVRLEIKEPVKETIRQIWLCPVCGLENAVSARWRVLQVMAT